MYEICYYAGQDHKVLASVPIAVTELAVKLHAPDQAVAGSTIEVEFEGPDYDGDYIGIGNRGKGYINYTSTGNRNPASLLVPLKAGTYEICYYAGQDHKVLASVPIAVTELAVKLHAPDQAVAGSTIEVEFEGPDYDGDYIGIGNRGKGYINYTSTCNGNPANLLVPLEPGPYEICYYAGQGQEVLASVCISIRK
jgi:Ca-activated chloride channel family protein